MQTPLLCSRNLPKLHVLTYLRRKLRRSYVTMRSTGMWVTESEILSGYGCWSASRSCLQRFYGDTFDRTVFLVNCYPLATLSNRLAFQPIADLAQTGQPCVYTQDTTARTIIASYYSSLKTLIHCCRSSVFTVCTTERYLP